MAHNYILQVTAGTDYDISKHQIVPVNTPTKITVESELISVDLNVRIQSYRGLPLNSPTTSPYFLLPPHHKSKDQYSICFSFTPKSNINGNDLVFGNDFDHPIRDRLPPGFGTAFKIVKWVVDPGLDGDVYAEKPYLYGPAASSVNTLHIGSKSSSSSSKPTSTSSSSNSTNGEENKEEDLGMVFQEGGDESGLEHRKEKGIPESEAARKKHFLNEENRKGWEWEEGRTYGCDFFNPYLDFNDFALRLPGFTLPIMKYWDGQGLRYVLKNRKTDTVLFVVLFTLYLKEDVDKDGRVKEGVEGGVPFELRGEGERGRYRRGVFGGGDGTEDSEEESSGESESEEEMEKGVGSGGGDDDVD
ncbi:hypothetical protein EG329_008097 [Mollisiaceae sp. DMI_Dod_QoI]|nr:hypothetical protein EG329_008097 [Helotiales sp. DMI_Dod_QoI]